MRLTGSVCASVKIVYHNFVTNNFFFSLSISNPLLLNILQKLPTVKNLYTDRSHVNNLMCKFISDTSYAQQVMMYR